MACSTDAVPDGCMGSGVWGSPTIDQTDGSAYFVPGDHASCSTPEPYAAGGNTAISGKSCLGSLRGLKPADGTFLWEDCLNDGPVQAAVSAVPGVAVVSEGKHLAVIATVTGQILFNYAAARRFWGTASISNGVLYLGNVNGQLYAFGP
jgi:outer membrane protein assembly factor BamB